MEKQIKELLKAIKDNSVNVELYKGEEYLVVPLKYIVEELEEVENLIKMGETE